MPPERAPQSDSHTPEAVSPLRAQQERWHTLNADIDNFLTGASEEERREFVKCVLDYSVVDGVKLAKKFGVGHHDAIDAGSISFVVHHARLCEELLDYVHAHKDRFPTLGELNDSIQVAERLATRAKRVGQEMGIDFVFQGTQGVVTSRHKALSPEFTQLLARTKKYYAEFLRGRKVEAYELPDARSQGEKVGESALLKMERVHKGSYYAGPVLDYIHAHLPESFTDRTGFRDEVLRKFFASEQIAKTAIDGYFTTDLLEEFTVQSMFHVLLCRDYAGQLEEFKYKPLAVVLDVEKKEAIKTLVPELEGMVARRNIPAHVTLDEATNRYCVEREAKPPFDFNIWLFGEHRLVPNGSTHYVNGRLFCQTGSSPERQDVRLFDDKTNLGYRTVLSGLCRPLVEVVGDDFYVLDRPWLTGDYSRAQRFYRDSVKYDQRPDMVVRDIKSFAGQLVCSFGDEDGGGECFVGTYPPYGGFYAGRQYESVSPLRGNDQQLIFAGRNAPLEGDANATWDIVSVRKDASGEDGFKDALIGKLHGGEYLRVWPVGLSYAYSYYLDSGDVVVGMPKVFEYMLGPHEELDEIVESNGRYVWKVSDDNKRKEKIVFGGHGNESREYDSIRYIIPMGDSFVYCGYNDGQCTIEGSNGLIAGPFGSCTGIAVVDNVLYYAVESAGHYGIFNQKGEVVYRPPYGEIIKEFGADKQGVFFRLGNLGERDNDRVYTRLLHDEKQGVAQVIEDLSPEEQRRLDLLNALQTTESTLVTKYYESHMQKKEADGKTVAGQSKGLIRGVQKMLADGRQELLATIAAKKDRKAELKMFAEYLFPQLQYPSAQERRRFGGLWGGSESKPDRDQYLQPSESLRFKDGDPRVKGGAEVLHTREPVHELIVSGVYGKLNKASNSFERALFAVDPDLDEPVKEYTFTISSTEKMHAVNLPYMLGSEVIPERVKGITKEGKEVLLSTQINILGESQVALDGKYQSVAYSLRRSELLTVPRELTTEAYEAFAHGFRRRYGDDLFEKVTVLPAEIDLFIHSLKGLPPLEVVPKIEQEVRRIGYYDFDNRDVQQEKSDASIEERVAVMQRRMDDIRNTRPDMQGELEDKLYAGVCADFNILVLAMLRRAGIASGLLVGFRPSGVSVTTDDAHGTAFVAWPSEKGNYKIISVDGTPSGVTEEEKALLKDIQKTSLAERVASEGERTKQLLKEASLRFSEIETMLESTDVDQIRGLSNGVLEGVVNTMLRYGVKESHFNVVRALLNASQYSQMNLRSMDLSDDGQAQKFRNFVASEIQRERSSEGSHLTPAGSELFSLIEMFGRKNGKDAYAKLEQVFDIIRPELDDMESRALIATIKYLEAKRVSH